MRSDAEIVAAVLSGHREDYAELVQRYERPVLAAAMSVLGERQAAEDAAQEAFLVAYLRVSSLRKPKAFGGWLLRIARNEAIRIANGKRKLEPLDYDYEAVDGQAEHVDEQCAAVVSAVMRLPEAQRVPVMLRYLDGLSVSQVAQATGRPVGTITVQLSRARKCLRRWLAEVRS